MLNQDIVSVGAVVRIDALRGRVLVGQCRADKVRAARTGIADWLSDLIQVLSCVAKDVALISLIVLAIFVKDHALDLDWLHLLNRKLEVVKWVGHV